MRRWSVFKCPECGYEVQQSYTGVPHSGSPICLNCEESMKSIKPGEADFEYSEEAIEDYHEGRKGVRKRKKRTEQMNQLDEAIKEFVRENQPVTEEEIREGVDVPELVEFDKVFGLTMTVLEETEEGFLIE